MEITLKIEGMMCEHCRERVKNALEALPQVLNVIISLEAGTAVVQTKWGTDIETLKKAVEDAGYKVS